MSCAGDFHEPVCLRPPFPLPRHISISLSAAYLPQGYPCCVLFPFRVTFPSVFSLSAAVFSFRRYSADYSPKSFQPAKLQKKSDICKFLRKIYYFAAHFSFPFLPFPLPSRPLPIPFPFRFRFVIEPLPHDNRNISVR